MKTINIDYIDSDFLNATGIHQTEAFDAKEIHAKLLDKLHAGTAHFIFMKGKNGDEPREAFGTLNKDLLERFLGKRDEDTTEPKEAPTEPVNQSYFDLDAVERDGSKGAFRMFKISQLIAVF